VLFRSGRKIDQRGFDFEGYREYQPEDDALAIDYLASARVDKKMVKVCRTPANRKVAVVIDPIVFSSESHSHDIRKKIAAIAGMIIAVAQKKNEQISLIVGDNYYFPSRNKADLFSMLMAIGTSENNSKWGQRPIAIRTSPNSSEWFSISRGNCASSSNEQVGSLQDVLADPVFNKEEFHRHSRVVVISNFKISHDAAAKSFRSLRARKVEVTPIDIGADHVFKRPVIVMGGLKMEVEPNFVKTKCDEVALQERTACGQFLRAIRGREIPLFEVDLDDLAAVRKKLGRPVTEDAGTFSYSMEGEEEVPVPETACPGLDLNLLLDAGTAKAVHISSKILGIPDIFRLAGKMLGLDRIPPPSQEFLFEADYSRIPSLVQALNALADPSGMLRQALISWQPGAEKLSSTNWINSFGLSDSHIRQLSQALRAKVREIEQAPRKRTGGGLEPQETGGRALKGSSLPQFDGSSFYLEDTPIPCPA
jgi:hypothetical protein